MVARYASSVVFFIGQFWIFFIILLGGLVGYGHENGVLVFGVTALIWPTINNPRPILSADSWDAASAEMDRLGWANLRYAAWDVVAVFLALALVLGLWLSPSSLVPLAVGACVLDILAVFKPIARVIARLGFQVVKAFPPLRATEVDKRMSLGRASSRP